MRMLLKLASLLVLIVPVVSASPNLTPTSPDNTALQKRANGAMTNARRLAEGLPPLRPRNLGRDRESFRRVALAQTHHTSQMWLVLPHQAPLACKHVFAPASYPSNPYINVQVQGASSRFGLRAAFKQVSSLLLQTSLVNTPSQALPLTPSSPISTATLLPRVLLSISPLKCVVPTTILRCPPTVSVSLILAQNGAPGFSLLGGVVAPSSTSDNLGSGSPK